MRALYTFISDSYLTPQRLWDSCRYEAWIMSAICMHLQTSLDAPWSQTCRASDASGSGMGVRAASFSEDAVADVGKWREKWRFKRLSPTEWAPRKSALDELDELTDPRTVVGAPARLEDQWDLHEGFPEVPKSMCDPGQWTALFAGRFKYDEHIGVKEGRAAVWSMRHICRNSVNHGVRHLLLTDNFGVVCSLDKGRSSARCILQICRRSAALQIATGCIFAYRWLASEYNPADRPSRRFERPAGADARTAKPSWRQLWLEGRHGDAARPAQGAQAAGLELSECSGRARGPPFAAPLPLRAKSCRTGSKGHVRQSLRRVRALARGAPSSGSRFAADLRGGPLAVPRLAARRQAAVLCHREDCGICGRPACVPLSGVGPAEGPARAERVSQGAAPALKGAHPARDHGRACGDTPCLRSAADGAVGGPPLLYVLPPRRAATSTAAAAPCADSAHRRSQCLVADAGAAGRRSWPRMCPRQSRKPARWTTPCRSTNRGG